MITVSVDGAAEVQRMLLRAGDQLPFALALALTRTVEQVKLEERQEMRRVFRNPIPYTLNSLYIKPATKSRLEARCWVKNDAGKGTPATKYLLPEVYGGARNVKRFEALMSPRWLGPSGQQKAACQSACSVPPNHALRQGW